MSLEIVIGPMFSGKSSYAMSYIRRQRVIGKKVVIIKPDIDNRYSNNDVLVTHDQETIQCTLWDITRPLGITQDIQTCNCLVIEEAQFFRNLKNFVIYLLKSYNINILLIGLDGDINQKPFGELLECIPYATNLTKLSAYCIECKNGTLAPFTKCNNPNERNITGTHIRVGGSEMYKPVCLKHL